MDTVDDMYKDDAEKVDVEAPSTGVVSNNGVAASVKPKIGKDTVTSSPPDVRSILQVLGTKAAAAAEALVELKAQPLQPPPLRLLRHCLSVYQASSKFLYLYQLNV